MQQIMRFDKGYVLLIAFKHPQNKIRVKSASFKKPHLCHDCGYVTNTVQHLRSLRSWCWSHQSFKSSTNWNSLSLRATGWVAILLPLRKCSKGWNKCCLKFSALIPPNLMAHIAQLFLQNPTLCARHQSGLNVGGLIITCQGQLIFAPWYAALLLCKKLSSLT